MPDLKVSCELADCMYFRRHEDEPRAVFCAHPEKHLYMLGACPLYKKQWDVQKEKSLLERFHKPRRPAQGGS